MRVHRDGWSRRFGRSGGFLFCVMGAMFVLSLKADAGIKKYIKMQGEEDSGQAMLDTRCSNFVCCVLYYPSVP